jgi:hypothetical protein
MSEESMDIQPSRSLYKECECILKASTADYALAIAFKNAGCMFGEATSEGIRPSNTAAILFFVGCWIDFGKPKIATVGLYEMIRNAQTQMTSEQRKALWTRIQEGYNVDSGEENPLK